MVKHTENQLEVVHLAIPDKELELSKKLGLFYQLLHMSQDEYDSNLKQL